MRAYSSRKLVVIGLALLVAVALGIAWFRRDVPVTYADIVDQFKYGSIGSDVTPVTDPGGLGVPYYIWLVLPKVFPEYLPQDRPGEGYEKLGFIFEPGQDRPIGLSRREKPVAIVGLNCAVCHIGTLRESPTSPRQIMLGAPAHQIDLQGYQRFLFAAGRDPRFTPDVLIPAMRAASPEFSWFDEVLYRFFIITTARDGLLRQAERSSWFDSRPDQGPGRVDTFNPYKVLLGIDIAADTTVGTADLPSVWLQGPREGLWLHWDGNNDSVDERNKSAGIGAGSTPDSLDVPALDRIAAWIRDLQPPSFPEARIDRSLAQRGRSVYEANCAVCHAFGAAQVGQVVPQAQVGTDPERVNSFTAELAQRMLTIGTGKPWQFKRFRKTDGYANMPLDGIWLRAPYLHNGSVPTLRDLLKPVDQRPKVFYRGYDVYDFTNLGWVSSGPEAERTGFRFDTSLKGNSNAGHTYGVNLSEADKDALIEYLKTE